MTARAAPAPAAGSSAATTAAAASTRRATGLASECISLSFLRAAMCGRVASESAARRGEIRLFARQLDAERRQQRDERDRAGGDRDDATRMLAAPQRVDDHARPEHDEPGDRAEAHDEQRREH